MDSDEDIQMAEEKPVWPSGKGKGKGKAVDLNEGVAESDNLPW